MRHAAASPHARSHASGASCPSPRRRTGIAGYRPWKAVPRQPWAAASGKLVPTSNRRTRRTGSEDLTAKHCIPIEACLLGRSAQPARHSHASRMTAGIAPAAPRHSQHRLPAPLNHSLRTRAYSSQWLGIGREPAILPHHAASVGSCCGRLEHVTDSISKFQLLDGLFDQVPILVADMFELRRRNPDEQRLAHRTRE